MEKRKTKKAFWVAIALCGGCITSGALAPPPSHSGGSAAAAAVSPGR
jgi:hypothetical protein